MNREELIVPWLQEGQDALAELLDRPEEVDQRLDFAVHCIDWRR